MAKRKKIDNTMAKRKKTDNTMAKRKKTDNTMAKSKKNQTGQYLDIYLRNKSWKPECVLSFNMEWRILVFYHDDKIY
jgi:hypothetical protein